MSDAPDSPGRPIPPDRAASVVRYVARARNARHIVKQLNAIRPDRIARARAGFARAMTDDEVPLVLVDTSFQRRGRSGFLLTNRAVYSSWLPLPVALADVRAVRHRPPDHSIGPVEGLLILVGCFFPLAHVLILPLAFRRRGRQMHALLINDRVAYAGTRNLAWGFWEEILPALRAELDEPAGRSLVAVLEVLPDERGAEPLRATAPPWEMIERTARALDGAGLSCVRLWSGAPGRSAGLEIIGGAGRYVVRALPAGWAVTNPAGGDQVVEVCPGNWQPGRAVWTDVDRVLDIARLFAEIGAFGGAAGTMSAG